MSTQPTAYNGHEPYIYASFTPEDSQTVIPLIARLQKKGFRICYYDGPQSTADEIEYTAQKIYNSSCFIVFLSRHCANSKRCIREINFAISLRKEPLAVFLETFDMTLGLQMQLGSMQALYRDRHDNIDSFLDELSTTDMMLPCRTLGADEYLERAKTLYAAKKYEEAAPLLRKAADLDDPEAQLILSFCYDSGYGVPIDRAIGAEWRAKAATSGYAPAQTALGLNYRYGVGVPQDLHKAVSLFREAAEKGDKDAQSLLSECCKLIDAISISEINTDQCPAEDMYEKGMEYFFDQDADADTSRSAMVFWLTQAARRSHAQAQYWLGLCYAKGIGVSSPDYAQAAHWYGLAANQGHMDAQFNLSKCYQAGTGVSFDQDKAAALLRNAADQGHDRSQYELAHYYMTGTFVPKHLYDIDTDYLAFTKAEEQMCYEQHFLGEHEAYEKLSPETFQEIMTLYANAANQDHKWAQAELAACFEYGLANVPRNIDKAFKWYHGALSRGSSMFAQDGVDRYEEYIEEEATPEYCYQRGMDFLKDGPMYLQKAIGWLKSAAVQGHTEAQYRMGLIREFHDSCFPAASSWYRKAAATAGHTGAADGLTRCQKKLHKRERCVQGTSAAKIVRPIAYEGEKPFAFISYAHKDSARVLPLLQSLQEKGHRIWYDAGIEAGTEWPEYIAAHLQTCSCVIAFISRSALASQNCLREINFALRLDKQMLTVYLEDVYPSVGLQMQLSALPSIHRNTNTDTQSLAELLCVNDVVQSCRETLPKTEIAPEIDACYKKGKELYIRREYKDAIEWIRNAAEAGHADAQAVFAEAYVFGHGVPRNTDEAEKWSERAAAQKDSDYQYYVAQKFKNGLHLRKNIKKAIKWFRKAAETGLVEAQKELAQIYDQGIDGQPNYTEAAKWYRPVALQGDHNARCRLGLFYERGLGVPQDFNEAVRWYRMALPQGDHALKAAIDRCVAILHSGMTAEDCYDRAEQYYHPGPQQDLQEALSWYHIAAAQGHARAQYCLGYCYEYAEGTGYDFAQAIEWYRKAAAQGQTGAHDGLNDCLEKMVHTDAFHP